MSQVFFSWSGDLARQIADVFARWIPTILQTVTAFYSPDIEKGTRWGTEIANALEQCGSGLVFATPDNLKSQWLNFEAGAISKLGNARVYVLIFGLKKSDLTGPLAQFQASDFTKDEIRNVLNSINENGEKIDSVTWQRAFDAIWPTIQKEIESLMVAAKYKDDVPALPARTSESLLEEVLLIVRRLDTNQHSGMSSDIPGNALESTKFNENSITYLSGEQITKDIVSTIAKMAEANQLSSDILEWIAKCRMDMTEASDAGKKYFVHISNSADFPGNNNEKAKLLTNLGSGLSEMYNGTIKFTVRLR